MSLHLYVVLEMSTLVMRETKMSFTVDVGAGVLGKGFAILDEGLSEQVGFEIYGRYDKSFVSPHVVSVHLVCIFYSFFLGSFLS
ncbi:hypothetical protein M501DRAFT_994901, partial [Patellaria atrata CBS 101060]